MRVRIPFIIVPALALTVAAIHAQIADPIQAPVEKRGLMVEIRDVVRLPMTRGMRPIEQDVNPSGWARVQFVRDLPDGRRFANDSRGFFYLLDKNNQPSVYANVAEAFPLRDLQPAGKRLHRLRLPSRVREERPVLHGAR